jgi:hypothetical protein
MKAISWRRTAFLKRVFPVLWFGSLGAFVAFAAATGAAMKDPLLAVVPLAIMALGFVLMKGLVWIAVDEVLDLGDALLVRKGRREQRVPLAHIRQVVVATNMNPPRITLRLEKPGELGADIVFFSASGMTLNPFRRCPVGEDLAARVKRARDKPSKKALKVAKARRGG